MSLLVQLCACSGLDPGKLAAERGFAAAVERGAGFNHLVLSRPGVGNTLHVYLEGDGKPWLSPGRIALDPTGTHFLMLDLAALDPAPVLYLGRPCYFGVEDPRCTPEWWTFYRYSEAVVASLGAVVSRHAGSFDAIALFGHSGGGALAQLLAARDSRVALVATIAPNLDIQAWTTAHDYTPLTGSLNPASQPPLPTAISQYHFLGGQDRNITRDMVQPVVDRQPNATLRVIAAYDHRCCWRDIWPQMLQEIADREVGMQARRPAGRREGAMP